MKRKRIIEKLGSLIERKDDKKQHRTRAIRDLLAKLHKKRRHLEKRLKETSHQSKKEKLLRKLKACEIQIKKGKAALKK